MFTELEGINSRPKAFEYYTAADLWTDPYTSEQMLAYHLNADIDVSSRKAAFIDQSVAWIDSRFNLQTGAKVADFGCGPGLYSLRLARHKANVTGIDFSERSIEYAREAAKKEGLNIQYVNQNYLEYETDERFDLIIMIMCDFCALSPVQRKVMLEKYHRLLVPGGALLMDVYSFKAFEKKEEVATYEINQLYRFWSPEKYYGFLNTFKYPQEKVILDKYTIIEKARTRTVYNWLQYFSPETLTAELKENGFEVQQLLADVAGSPYDEQKDEFAIIAGKSIS